jgi:hypothetical protein
VTDNEASRSRVRFVGSAKIDSSWSAGYLLELGTRGNRQDNVSQSVDNGAASKTVDVRHSVWWLQNKDLGKVWMGMTSDAADGITELNLANTGHFATPQIQDYVNSFGLRNPNGTIGATFSNLWNGSRAGANPGEGDRFNVVKYDTPTIAGFIGSASWGENDQWALALRYAGEFNGVKVAAGIAYADITDGYDISSSTGLAQNGARGCTKSYAAGANGHDVSCNELGLSGSIMHVPTGLYATGAYGYKEDDNRAFLATPIRKKDDFYYIQAGIEQKFFPVGKSTLFGEYFNGTYGSVNGTPTAGDTTIQSKNRTCNFTGCSGVVTKAAVEMWGIGFNQNIEAAAMDLYVGYRNYSADAFDSLGNKSNYNDIQMVTTGAVIKF